MANEIPWEEKINTFQINPHAASVDDISRMATELSDLKFANELSKPEVSSELDKMMDEIDDCKNRNAINDMSIIAYKLIIELAKLQNTTEQARLVVEPEVTERCAFEEITWVNLDKLPDNYSFRCLIEFENTGANLSSELHHVSTGYYWHVDKSFSIDDKEMQKMIPVRFAPLYETITSL